SPAAADGFDRIGQRGLLELEGGEILVASVPGIDVEHVGTGGFAGRHADVRPRAGRPPLSDGLLVGRGVEDPTGNKLADRVFGSALVAARAPARADSVPSERMDGQD